MNLSRRTFLSVAAGAAAALALNACSDDSSGGAASGNGKPALQQWYHEYGEDGVQDAVNRYAGAYPDADVTVTWNPGNYDQLIPTVLLTADVPDIFEYANGPTLDMIKAGQVLDLSDLIGEHAGEFNQPVLERLTYQGKIWAVPQCIDMQLLYYRPSLLDAAGLQPPTTFADLAAAANTLADRGAGGFFAGNDSGLGVLGLLFIWASGHEMLNSDQSGLDFLTDDFYAGLEAFRELFNSPGLVHAASGEWSSPDAFINGEAALQWSGLWALPQIEAAFGTDFGVLPFPAIGAGGRPAVPFGAYSACISAKSSNADAAQAFVKWLWIDQTEYQVDFATSYGTHIPAKPALADQSDKLATGPGAAAAAMVANHGFANHILWTSALNDAYAAALSDVIKKNADPAGAFASLPDKAATELERAKN